MIQMFRVYSAFPMKQARIAGQSEKTGCGLMAPKVKSKVHTEEQVLSTMPAEPPAGPCA